MRKIITTTFVTLDGVMQAPGGPNEDTSSGFKYGGWIANYWDDMMSVILNGFMSIPFELLLGRKTYDIFASYWPTANTDHSVTKPFNSTKKYVISHQPLQLSWNNSESITGDVVEEIKKLKAKDDPDLWVHGSGNLIQTLLKHHLIDRMHIWEFPVTIGGGKQLFANGTQADSFRLIDSKSSTTGVVIRTYEPAGALITGSV